MTDDGSRDITIWETFGSSMLGFEEDEKWEINDQRRAIRRKHTSIGFEGISYTACIIQ